MRKGRKKRRIAALMLLAAGVLAAGVFRARVDPMLETLAGAAVSDAASRRINEAVAEQIESGEIAYDSLVRLEKDESGAVIALTTNMQEMNRMKTGLLGRLDRAVEAIDSREISVPLGNLTGADVLSGRGPAIPVKILSVAASDAVFRGTFLEAGINQTVHRIMLEVSMEVVILLPTGAKTQAVSTELCVAETVLLGKVPESYFAGETGAVYVSPES